MLVLGISGSLRRDSHNRQLLHAAAGVRPSGVEFKEWRGLAALPAYDADLDDGRGPAAAGEMRAAFAGADALLISTPEYNASVPGALKNAIDWASRPFPDNALRDKPVAVVGASTGLFGAVWAQAELRKALATAGARPLDTELPVASAHQAFDRHGSLRDHDQRAALTAIVTELVDAVRAKQTQAASSARPWAHRSWLATRPTP